MASDGSVVALLPAPPFRDEDVFDVIWLRSFPVLVGEHGSNVVLLQPCSSATLAGPKEVPGLYSRFVAPRISVRAPAGATGRTPLVAVRDPAVFSGIAPALGGVAFRQRHASRAVALVVN